MSIFYNSKFGTFGISVNKEEIKNSMTRIEPKDDIFEIATKLSEGNPGAAVALGNALKIAENVDPESAWGLYGPAILLDTIGIYGSSIHMLYKDVCKENAAYMIGLLRAAQLGIINKYALTTAINNYGEGINIQDVLDRVKEILPTFNTDYVAT